MLIPLARLHPDRTPVRHGKYAEDDEALDRSMRELGQLEPLLVVRLGDDFDEAPAYEVKDGNRRLAAAQRLGMIALEVSELAGHRPSYLHAAATAANLVRAPLPPVDQWRAIIAVQERGRTLPEAAAALGLSDRQAARLDRLGRLHPSMLKLIEEAGIPYGNLLTRIAAASHKKQEAALKVKGAVQRAGGSISVTWHLIAEACAEQRIPKARAIFDADASGIAWEQDFFVPEGSDEEWTTTDTTRFLECQRAALAAQATDSKGKLAIATESTRHPGEVTLPKGWRATDGNPDKPTRRETVFAIVTARGEVVRACGLDAEDEKAREKAAKQKAKKAAKATAVPSAIGTIATPIGGPQPDNTTPGASKYADTEQGDDADDDAPSPPPAGEPKHPLTKAGQKILAGHKTTALRACLRDRTTPIDTDTLLALLILALHAPNVTVQSYDRPPDGTHYGDHQGHDLVRRLVTPAGLLQFDAAELPTLAAEALARVLSCSEPEEGSYNRRSGVTAEWTAAAIGASAHMPRLDTAELLATADAATLRAAALAAEIKFTTAGAAKRELPGQLEAWHPAFAHFGAPGPKPAGRDA